MDNTEEWWKKAVVYQIYPRSFCDSNGDGIGDLNGITSKLDYLKELGVDMLWLSPIYKSPMRDNGYDISDYREINPEFGTMQDFSRLVKKAYSMKMYIMMDLVINHTSNEHPWFKESSSNPKSLKRNYYIWQDNNKGEPPNDWIAWFGGPAWSCIPSPKQTYEHIQQIDPYVVRSAPPEGLDLQKIANQPQTTEPQNINDQYYLHLFSPYQPDLNWENPQVRKEIYDIMHFWLHKGVRGFRLDVINLISKPLDNQKRLHFPNGNEKQIVPNGPRVHEYLQEMNREVLSKYDIMTVGEMVGATVEDAVKYANAEGTELNMVFQSEHVDLDSNNGFKWTDKKINLLDLKYIFERWQKGLYDRAWNSLYWCNHDQPRIVSRLGNDAEHREKSAKMLATCLHFMQGTPFIYQGEELGMTNAPFESIEDFRDIESINAYEALTEANYFSKEQMLKYMRLKSRDNARTPMQWNNEPNAGFTTGVPWIMVNPNYTEINAEEQMYRSGSVFQYYKKLIELRKEMDIITYGDFELLLPEHSDLFVYARNFQNKKLLVVCNFSNEERTFILPEGFTGKNLLIANDETHRTYTMEISSQGYRPKPCVVLGPYGAAVYRRY